MPKQMCRSPLDYFTLNVKYTEVNISLLVSVNQWARHAQGKIEDIPWQPVDREAILY